MNNGPAAQTWAATAEGATPALPKIPGYELLAELGRGGMGVVYRARQVSLGRLVALKLIRDGALAGPLDRARFRIETEAAARMRHPHIVEILDVGEHAGQPYFAMELVAGGSLAEHLAGRPQPPTSAAALARILALAVQHAHEQQIVHRDLKPANILLAHGVIGGVVSGESAAPLTIHDSPLASHCHPKITDFGLAKRLDSDSTAFTQAGAVLGTASYMVPEQAAGRTSEVKPVADIYSLGAILFELLTGRPPFQADSWNQTVQQVLNDDPPRPTMLAPGVPPGLEAICLRCLEKEPSRRYATAGELAEDLGRFLAGQTVVAAPLDHESRLVRQAERDGFRIVGQIGRGPRSTVYRALHGPLQQSVALKVFAEGTCTRDEWEERLRRNAEQSAVLAHPHIMSVQQAGWWDGSPYLAIEHVPGGSLAGRLGGQPIPLREALGLVEQLAETVGYLHRQGVVHGNLKPTNVLMAADGIPRITDFLLMGRASDADDATGLAYLPPELLSDADYEPRPNTDLYGLGLILYELLTGKPPFDGASAREVLEQVRSQDPQPPSQLNPQVSPQLCAVCLRCLRKDPWRRFRRVYDLRSSLRQLKENPAGRPMRPSPPRPH